jgi:3-hydroxy acid dehydrogenase / malonic semialdehyde reductase
MFNFAGTVLITGASAGIGEACARAFAAAGSRLILAARRTERLEALAAELADLHGTESHLVSLDVRDPGVVAQVLEHLPGAWGEIDVLVNNAGLSRALDRLQEGDDRDWDEMIDTNVKGLLYVTRTVLPGMIARGRGHVINLGSIAGREVYVGGAVYCATKAAVEKLTQAMRLDLLGTGVRVTNVMPGLVETEFSLVRFKGDEERAEKVYQGYEPLRGEDIADVILFAATRPPRVNIDEILLKPLAQAAVGMVHKKQG